MFSLKYSLVVLFTLAVPAQTFALSQDQRELTIKRIASKSKKLVVGQFVKSKYGIRNSEESESPITKYIFSDVEIVKKNKVLHKRKFRLKANVGLRIYQDGAYAGGLETDEVLLGEHEFAQGMSFDGSVSVTDYIYNKDGEELERELANSGADYSLETIGGLPQFSKGIRYAFFIAKKSESTLMGITGNAAGIFRIDEHGGVYTFSGVPILSIRKGRVVQASRRPDLSSYETPVIASTNIKAHRVYEVSGAPLSYESSTPMHIDRFTKKISKWIGGN